MANQIDLPPVSFARYLDLLKRRRWQVIPATLAGLLVGAFVAFLIPRYYVAKATLAYRGVPFDQDGEEEEDEFSGVIGFANESIPLQFVEPALIQLEMIGPGTSDEEREPIILSAQERVEVTVNQGGRDGWPRVVITYKDVDGANAAAFTNAISTVWMESVVADLAASARKELEDANAEVDAAKTVVDGLLQIRSGFQQRFGIGAIPDPSNSRVKGSYQLDGEISQMGVRLNEFELELIGKESLLQQRRIQLDSLDQFLPVSPQGADIPPELQSVLQAAQAQAERARQAAERYREGTVQRASYERSAVAAEAKLQQVLQTLSASNGGALQKENPRFKEIQQEIRLLEVEIGRLTAQIDQLEKDKTRLEERRAELPQQLLELEQVQAKLERAEEDLEEIEDMRDRLQRQADQITDRELFIHQRAVVPPAPTDPNIVIVALTGSIVGLAAAIGLVLLIDFLRSTFKTVEDVAYAIPVPILGSMAYLETAEVRQAQTRTRRKIALISGAFFALLAGVILMYNVAPTRLPTVVTDFLESIFGTPQ